MMVPLCVRPYVSSPKSTTRRIAATTWFRTRGVALHALSTSQQGPATGVWLGSASGVATWMGAELVSSATSTSISTGTATVTDVLSWKRPESLISSNSSSVSRVCHSPSCGRVLRKSAPSEMRFQTRTSTFAVVSIVRVAANAPSAPPMAMAAIRAAMIALFMGAQAYAGEWWSVVGGRWPVPRFPRSQQPTASSRERSSPASPCHSQ